MTFELRETIAAHEEVLTLKCTKLKRKNLDHISEVTFEFKGTIAAHEEVQDNENFTNKKIDRLKTTLNQTRVIKELIKNKFLTAIKMFKLYLEVYHVESKVEEFQKMESPTTKINKDNQIIDGKTYLLYDML